MALAHSAGSATLPAKLTESASVATPSISPDRERLEEEAPAPPPPAGAAEAPTDACPRSHASQASAASGDAARVQYAASPATARALRTVRFLNAPCASGAETYTLPPRRPAALPSMWASATAKATSGTLRSSGTFAKDDPKKEDARDATSAAVAGSMTTATAPPSRARFSTNAMSGPNTASAKPRCATPPPAPARATFLSKRERGPNAKRDAATATRTPPPESAASFSTNAHPERSATVPAAANTPPPSPPATDASGDVTSA